RNHLVAAAADQTDLAAGRSLDSDPGNRAAGRIPAAVADRIAAAAAADRSHLAAAGRNLDSDQGSPVAGRIPAAEAAGHNRPADHIEEEARQSHLAAAADQSPADQPRP